MEVCPSTTFSFFHGDCLSMDPNGFQLSGGPVTIPYLSTKGLYYYDGVTQTDFNQAAFNNNYTIPSQEVGQGSANDINNAPLSDYTCPTTVYATPTDSFTRSHTASSHPEPRPPKKRLLENQDQTGQPSRARRAGIIEHVDDRSDSPTSMVDAEGEAEEDGQPIAEGQREQSLARNRAAANRYRERRNGEQIHLKERADELTQQRSYLMTTIQTLRNEIITLKMDCLHHTACSDTRLRDYLESTVSRTSPAPQVYDNPQLSFRSLEEGRRVMAGTESYNSPYQ